MDKSITVVTVVFNDIENIERTIRSVLNQTYTAVEYLIIDGQSTDGTLDILNKYSNQIKIISEPDRGIYDAMNKAINLAQHEWIIFMNSGDEFVENTTLQNIFNENLSENKSFIYSDFLVRVGEKIKTFKSSFENGILLHQSVIYKKNLHDRYGMYLVTKKYIVSDYIFFMMQNESEVFKTQYCISINQEAGVSAASWCGYQKLCVDYLFNRITILKLIQLLIDRIIKNYIKRILKIK